MDLADQIARLQELHREGALTDSEFQEAKAAVLSRDVPTTRQDLNAPETTSRDLPQLKPVDGLGSFAPRGNSASVYAEIVSRGGSPATLTEIASELNMRTKDAFSSVDWLQRRGVVQFDVGEDSSVESWIVRLRPGAPTTGDWEAHAAKHSPRPPRASRSAATASSQSVRLGGWLLPVLLFSWLGGLIGYFSLKDADPARANLVMKWGLIMTAVYAVGWLLLLVSG